jgi:hypothetical protein
VFVWRSQFLARDQRLVDCVSALARVDSDDHDSYDTSTDGPCNGAAHIDADHITADDGVDHQ